MLDFLCQTFYQVFSFLLIKFFSSTYSNPQSSFVYKFISRHSLMEPQQVIVRKLFLMLCDYTMRLAPIIFQLLFYLIGVQIQHYFVLVLSDFPMECLWPSPLMPFVVEYIYLNSHMYGSFKKTGGNYCFQYMFARQEH